MANNFQALTGTRVKPISHCAWFAPLLTTLTLFAFISLPVATAQAGAGHGSEVDDQMHMMQEMIEEHGGHDHGHDFEAMKNVSPADMRRIMGAMMDIGLAVPPMDSDRGRGLFVSKGCVACHAVNGVGGEMGPALDAAVMPSPMNTFDFAARMWRGAPAMAELQEEFLGDVISLTGQDLADIVAFAHDEGAQRKLDKDQVPAKYRELIGE